MARAGIAVELVEAVVAEVHRLGARVLWGWMMGLFL